MALLRDMVRSASATVLMAVGRFVGMTLIARRLGVEDFGTIAFAVFTVELLILLGMFGLPGVLSRFYPIALQGQGAPRRGFNGFMLGWTLVSASVLLLVAPLVAHLAVSLPTGGVMIYTAWALSAAVGALGIAFMQGCFRYDLVSAGSALHAIVICAMVYLLVEPGGTETAMIALAAAALVLGLPALMIWIQSDAIPEIAPDIPPETAPRLPTRREILIYGGNVWIAGICGALLWSRGEMMALKALTDERALGLYGAAITITALVWRATSLFQGAVGPHLSRHVASENPERLHAFVLTMNRLTLAVSGVAAMVLALFGTEVTVLVFGADFAEAGMLTTILAPGSAMAGIGTANLAAQFLSNGRFTRNAQVVGAVALGGLAWGLLALFGLPGAALARVAVLCGIAAAVVVWLWHHTSRDLGQRLAGDVVLIMFGICCLSMINLSLSPHWALRGAALLLCAYGSLIWISGTVRPLRMIPETLRQIRAI